MLQDLTNKEFAIVVISSIALLVSLASAFFTIRTAFEKRADDARKAFDDAIDGLQTARADFENLRHELGSDFHAAKSHARRVLISDRRNFFLNKCLTALKGERFLASGYDNLLIAAAMIESGRSGSAVPFYARAVTDAFDEFERASARRVLGRALILSGDRERGRAEMHLAMTNFYGLEHNEHFDRNRMHREGVETLRRLVEASMFAGLAAEVEIDSEELLRILPTVDGFARPLHELTLERAADWLFHRHGNTRLADALKSRVRAQPALVEPRPQKRLIRQMQAGLESASTTIRNAMRRD